MQHPPQLAPVLALFALLAAACVSDPAPVPAEPRTASAGAPRGLERAPAPGKEHELLAPLVGEWRIELFSAGGGAPIATGDARIDWCLAGRFLCWDARFELERGSSPSSGLLGYDAVSGEYQWVWASGWSGRASLARGRGELAGAGLRLVSEEVDPATGAVARARSVMRMPSADELEIAQDVETAPGAWRPTTRTVYTRAAGPE